MKNKVRIRNIFLTVWVGAAASSAAALSLGNPQGTVVLGRPLDLVFDVRTDGAKLADACVSADVTAGDTLLSHSQIRVSPVRSPDGQGTAIRVQSTQPINEPVLSVRLVAGCAGSVVRTYTVLAYPETSLNARQRAAANSVGMAEPAVAIASAPLGQTQPSGEVQGGRAKAATEAMQQAPKTRPSTKRAKRIRAATQAAVTPQPAEEVGRSRLVMEPLSDWLEAPSVLRASPEIATLSPVSPALREEAAARWRALNMQPQELLQEAARLVAQETELSKQRSQGEREKAAALQVQQSLERRVAERFPAQVVYLLGALLLLLVGAFLWLWVRFRRSRPEGDRSWTQAVAQNVGAAAATPISTAVPGVVVRGPVHADHSFRVQPTEPELLPSGMIPLEFGLAHEAVSAEPVRAVTSVALDAPAEVGAVVNPEDLFDLQQQAEFFVSVGEHDQAIDVMKKHIDANQTSSPLAYLELLRLYRSLSRIEQFSALRAQFHRYFNAQVPEFAAFSRQGRTLFAYPEVLARIEALWCDPSVVPLLQELLFRGQASEQQRFDLPAYDDLLLLHAVARTTPAAARGTSSPRSRTTPLESTDWEAPQAELVAPPAAQPSNLMEFEHDWAFETPGDRPAEPKGAVDSMALDLDLSDLTHLDSLSPPVETSAPLPFLTQEEVPAVPATAPPAPHQPVGFGSNSDRFEARVDPDVRKPR